MGKASPHQIARFEPPARTAPHARRRTEWSVHDETRRADASELNVEKHASRGRRIAPDVALVGVIEEAERAADLGLLRTGETNGTRKKSAE